MTTVEISSNKSILLDENKTPLVVVTYKPQKFGTSLLDGVQTFLFQLENVSDNPEVSINLKANFLNQTKEFSIDVEKGKKLPLFLTYQDVDISFNSVTLPLSLTINQDEKRWKITKKLLVNQASLNVKIIGDGFYNKKVFVKDIKQWEIKDSIHGFFVPTYSNKQYTLTFSSSEKKHFLIKVGEHFVIDSHKKVNNNLFKYKIMTIKGRKRYVYKIIFTLPESKVLKEEVQNFIHITKYKPQLPKNNLEVLSDSKNIKCFYEDGMVRINSLSKNTKPVKISILKGKGHLFDFILFPKKDSVDEVIKSSVRKIQPYFIDKAKNKKFKNKILFGEMKWGSIYFDVNGKKEKLQDVEYTPLVQSVLYKSITRKKADVYLEKNSYPVTVLKKNQEVEGILYSDGSIKYINGMWWSHVSFFKDREFNFLVKKNSYLRDKPYGKRVRKISKFTKFFGSFVNKQWVCMENRQGCIHIRQLDMIRE
ncbi:MAG: hypothetical protein OIF32_08365 [Campylobacterales bacterium]|nr:hypothetical protein [Campylobacterales bacterium]